MAVYTEVPDEGTRAALKRLGDQFGRYEPEAATKPGAPAWKAEAAPCRTSAHAGQ